MDKYLCFFFFFSSSIISLGVSNFPEDHLKNSQTKFEFKYSFKPPMLVNSKGEVPFWERGGDAIPTENQIRVCPSIQDRRGWLWNKNAFVGSSWMIDVDFSISGKLSYGADGMAFWFTQSKGFGGPLFGNTNNFVGMGIIIDTFDNNGNGDTPKIGAYISDGSLNIDQAVDGHSQDKASCIRYIRNTRFTSKMRIVYFQKKLEVWIHEGVTDNITAYELCFELNDVTLPASGYFGVSAATGGLSDDHDVKAFLVHSLITLEEYRQKMIDKYDRKKMEEMQGEYEKMSESFDSKKQQYRKEHQKEEEAEWEKRMELEENVQMIYDMQQSLIRSIRDMTRRVEAIKGGSESGASDSTVLAAEGRITHHLQELRSQMEKGGTTGGSSGTPTSEQMQPFYEMRENISKLMKKVEELGARNQSSTSGNVNTSCATSCLSTWFFVMAMFVQCAIVVAFLYYKHSQERNAKKFF